ncbi:MAG: tRNA uridine-5-carboxymethylaminomethyl(34) synthesis GTPase MnmE [Candidatus Symbiodolus clandestinus]
MDSSLTTTETIVAQATASGRGGIGILRVCGPEAANIARAVTGRCPAPRYADYRHFYDQTGEVIDQGIVLFFPKPHSFTGDDVLELHGHGGQVLLDMLLNRILQHPGVRLARPGEFSERAFLNHKIDLAQAEAIADLIDASSQQAARAAMRSLQGHFSQQIQAGVDSLMRLRIQVEADLDFADEGLDTQADIILASELTHLLVTMQNLQTSAHQGVLLREGIQVVLAGQPNAGKSSLMNQLSGDQTSIVTPIPGTTRDILRCSIQIDGFPVHVVDTAGLRKAGDEIEQIGINRAWEAIQKADQLLWVIDGPRLSASTAVDAELEPLRSLPPSVAVTLIYNKIDLVPPITHLSELHGYPVIYLSAQTGAGLEQLRQHIKRTARGAQLPEGNFLARRRHLTAIEQAISHIQDSQSQLLAGGNRELLAESLRLAQQSLGTITGQVTADQLLGEIFSQFCIGK